RMPLWRGEDGHVDVFAGANVLEDRSVFDLTRWQRLKATNFVAPGIGNLDLGQARLEAKREGDAIGSAEAVDQDLEVGIIAGDLVEQRGGRLGGVLQHVGGCADLLFGV